MDQNKANQLAEHLGLSGYGGIIPNPEGGRNLVISTDGVGTKLLFAEHFNKFDTVGIDLVAMCVNDILCCGARPLAFLDYFATGELDLDKAKSILAGVLKGCELAQCDLVGGETAQLSNTFKHKEYFDLAGFALGVQEKKFELVNEQMFIHGIPSSGLHSNGFTLIRERYGFVDESLLTPTRIYVDEIMNNLEDIEACAHITGGGITGNVPRVLAKGMTYYISSFSFDDFLPYWKEVQSRTKLTWDEMLSTFNCGFGMLIFSKKAKLNISDAYLIGEVLNGQN